MSIQNIAYARKARPAAWLTGASILVATAAPGFAAEPAAALLPPVISAAPVVSRASGDEIVPLDPLPPVVKAREREPDFVYPPPYSKQNNLIDWSVVTKIFERSPRPKKADVAKEVKPAPVAAPSEGNNDIDYPPPYSNQGGSLQLVSLTTLFDRSSTSKKDNSRKDTPNDDRETNEPDPAAAATDAEPTLFANLHHKPAIAHATGPAAALALPAVPPMEVPAWRWYGYGAPVPGRNPYAPDGVYAPVHPNWYHQTGATPGAIPRPLMPMIMPMHAAPVITPSPALPTLPPPATVEPPRIMMSHPAEEPAPPVDPLPETLVRPATLDLPVPAGGATPQSESWKPLSARMPAPVVRAQAPELKSDR